MPSLCPIAAVLVEFFMGGGRISNIWRKAAILTPKSRLNYWFFGSHKLIQ